MEYDRWIHKVLTNNNITHQEKVPQGGNCNLPLSWGFKLVRYKQVRRYKGLQKQEAQQLCCSSGGRIIIPTHNLLSQSL